MKTIAITAEYNPLHEGHSWQLREARQRAGADFVVVLMSGDFVQRGEPAIFDKYTRAASAISAGADLVLELPVACATGSAQRFAEGAVAMADRIGAIDELWFGSEEGAIEPIFAAAQVLAEEPEIYRDTLRGKLQEGLAFPAAREAALQAAAPDIPTGVLSGPNNILGTEYCRALIRGNSKIRPCTHERTDTASAGDLRKQTRAAGQADAIWPDDFSSELRYQLLKEDEQSLAGYLDVAPDFARRVIRNMHGFQSFTQFAELLDTRDRTRTAVSRALLHILLGIRDADFEAAKKPVYARMLAKGSCEAYLSVARASGGIPIIANPANEYAELYARDLFASNLYESVLAAKEGREPIHDFSRRLIG